MLIFMFSFRAIKAYLFLALLSIFTVSYAKETSYISDLNRELKRMKLIKASFKKDHQMLVYLLT